MTRDQMIQWGSENPKKLFLMDATGAIVSSLLLGIVLVKLESVFGIPKPTLYFLSALPCLFAAYDFYCYFKIGKKIGPSLKVIAVANLLYCGLSIVLAISHFDKLTSFGWAYIIGEIILVTGIALFELTIAKKIEHDRFNKTY